MGRLALILLTCLLTAAAVACPQPIFIWKMETEPLVDPDGGGSVQQDYAVKRALDELELIYEVGRDLPEDLSPYRVIFVLMGWWC